MNIVIEELINRIQYKDEDLSLPEIVELLEIAYMAGRLRSLASVSSEDCGEMKTNILREMSRIRYESPYN